MSNIYIDDKFYRIKKILDGECEISKKIMKEILQKYPIKMDLVIKETIKNLNKTTNLYWEPLIKTEYYKGTEERIDPYASISNYYVLRDPNYTDRYNVDVYGNRQSKIIRCANFNKYFLLTQKTNDKIPEGTTTFNGDNYDEINIDDFFNFQIIQDEKEDNSSLNNISSPFSFYNFDAYIDKNTENNVSTDLVFNIFESTFKDLYADTIDIILNEFQEEIKKYIEKTTSALITYNEKLSETNKKIDENNKYLDSIKFPSIEDFNKFVSNFNYNDEVKNNTLYLPNIEDVIKKIHDFHNKERDFLESKEFDKSEFRIQKNDNGDIGWYWFLDFFFGTEDKPPFKGNGNFFVKVNPKLFDISPKVKSIIEKIKFKYIEDPNYKEKYYESTDYATNLPKMYFKTFKSGILIPLYDGKEITFEKLNNILEELKNTAKEIFNFTSNVDINDPKVIEFMYNRIKEEYYKEIDDEELEKEIKEKMKDEKYWNNRSYSYSSFRFDCYYSRVLSIINEIKDIIEYANKNKEKGDFFKNYSTRCIELFKGYTAYTDNSKLTDEKSKITSSINMFEEQLKKLNYSYNLITALKPNNYQKKKD